MADGAEHMQRCYSVIVSRYSLIVNRPWRAECLSIRHAGQETLTSVTQMISQPPGPLSSRVRDVRHSPLPGTTTSTR